MRIIYILIVLLAGMSGSALAELPKICEEGKWVSAMHPNFRGDEGDNCPVCGMEMVPDPVCFPDKNPDKIGKADIMPDGAIKITPIYQQALSVKTAPVSRKEFGQHIRSFGEIVSSTRHEIMFHMRAEGWIVDMATDAEGDTVKKGDLLFTYYSPDLMNAQSDYLIGNRVGNAEERLRLFGMDDKAIAQL